MPQHIVPSGHDSVDFLLRENQNLRNRVQALEGRRLSTWDRGDHETIAAPTEGQHIVDLDESVWYYSNGEWRPISVPTYCIKLWADWQTVRTGDGRFQFYIDQKVGGQSLSLVELYVTTASSSGIVQVQVRKNTATDMLSTRIQVDANENHSMTAATTYVINTANAEVAHGDKISIDVDAAGTGARGAGISLTFS